MQSAVCKRPSSLVPDRCFRRVSPLTSLPSRKPITDKLGVSRNRATKHTVTTLSHQTIICLAARARQLKISRGATVTCFSAEGEEGAAWTCDGFVLSKPGSLLSGVVKGFSAAVQGGTNSVNTASSAYKYLTAAVFATSLFLDAGGIYSINVLAQGWLGSDPGLLWVAMIAVFKVSLGGAVVFVSPLLSVAAVQQALPLLGERLFLEALKDISPSRAEALERSDGLGIRGVSVVVERTLLFLKWQFGLLLISIPVGFVPVVGPLLAAGAQLTLSSYIFGWEMLDVWFDKNAVEFEEQKRITSSQKWAILGFAAPYTLLLAVPLFGPFGVGIAQSAAARLVTRVLEEPGADIE